MEFWEALVYEHWQNILMALFASLRWLCLPVIGSSSVIQTSQEEIYCTENALIRNTAIFYSYLSSYKARQGPIQSKLLKYM